MLFTVILGVVLAVNHSSVMVPEAFADVIVPMNDSGTVQQFTGIPEAVMVELDATVAQKLHPAVAAYFASPDQALLKESYLSVAGETNSLPAFEVFLAKLLSAYNRLPEALLLMEQYTNENSEDPEAYITMGSVAIKSGRLVDAWLQLLYAHRLIERGKLPEGRSKFVVPILTELRATVAERRRQWAEAEQLYRQLQELKPESAYPLWLAGRVKVRAGELQAGFDLLVKAYEKDNQLPNPSLAVAQTLHDSGEWLSDPKAATRLENWYKRVLSDLPDDPNAWAAYFKWLVLANRPEEVAHRFDHLPESVKGSREVRLIRCVAARYQNDFALAESILSEAHQSNVEDLEIADQLALVLIESTDEAKRGRALQIAERNMRKAPQSEPVLATAAWIQLRLGSLDIANQILSQLVARGNLPPQTAYYVAELMAKSGKTVESQRLLKMAVEQPGIFPQRAQAKSRLGG